MVPRKRVAEEDEEFDNGGIEMDSEIIEEENHSIRILLKGTDRASVNALRRTMMADTPKMAIHKELPFSVYLPSLFFEVH